MIISIATIVYILMLLKDVEKVKLSEHVEDKKKLFMEEVTFSEAISEDRTLTINVKRVVKVNGVIEGEDISLQLERAKNGVILGVCGRNGICDFNEAKVVFSKGVWGKFGELEWESANLFWDIRADEVRVKEVVKFKVKEWVGSSSEMIIYPDKRVIAFVGEVKISSHGN